MKRESSSRALIVALGGLGLALFGTAAVIVLVAASTLFGAISGWIVGGLFGETILGIVGQFGLHDISMWQFGAFMGFVGGYLGAARTQVKTS